MKSVDFKTHYQALRRPTRNLAIACYFLAAMLIVSATFFAGRHSVYVSRFGNYHIIDAGSALRVYQYNSTYSSPPSSDSNEAWAALFPEGQGWFQHPDLAPDGAVLAVYHQLHCLVGSLRILEREKTDDRARMPYGMDITRPLLTQILHPIQLPSKAVMEVPGMYGIAWITSVSHLCVAQTLTLSP